MKTEPGSAIVECVPNFSEGKDAGKVDAIADSIAAVQGVSVLDVTLDPDSEAIVTIGAKDALAHLLFAVVGPGDMVVSPNPAYPIHQYGVLMAEGQACMLPMPDAATRRRMVEYFDGL